MLEGQGTEEILVGLKHQGFRALWPFASIVPHHHNRTTTGGQIATGVLPGQFPDLGGIPPRY